MAPRQITAKSSLFSHAIPPFYACYLLKSVKPDTNAIYIGSTPSPPRRIRQHNGEIAQGARQTRSKRPWVMQMIVHGFPSKLAALRFEWAWQHPSRSRYLRDGSGKKLFSHNTSVMKKSIEIVQTMIRTNPFSLWPLHVKLFTEEATNIWQSTIARQTAKSVQSTAGYFPPGFTSSVELEGVDGRSGHPQGSGRTTPLDVKDEHFISAVLAKNTAIAASGNPNCAVCGEEVRDYATTDPLTIALCPNDNCVSVSHLLCLSKLFLDSPSDTPPFTQLSRVIPRGGRCPSCAKYILWGDIVRGSYRRVIGASDLEGREELGEIEEEQEIELLEQECEALVAMRHSDGDPEKDLFTSDSEIDVEATPKARRKMVEPDLMSSPTKAMRRRRSKTRLSSGSGESFDLDVSSSSDSEGSTNAKKPRTTRTGKALGTPCNKNKGLGTSPPLDEDNIVKRRRGEPPKAGPSALKGEETSQERRRGRPRKLIQTNDSPPSKQPRVRPPKSPREALIDPKTPRGRGRLPKSPASQRGLSTAAATTSLLDLDSDRASQLGYNPSIFTTLRSEVCTPEKDGVWVDAAILEIPSSDAENEVGASEHVDEIASKLGTLTLNSGQTIDVDSEEDLFLP